MRYLPDAAIGPTGTAVMLAVVTMDRPTITDVANATGLSRSAVHWHLRAMRRRELVDWEDGAKGTLHATCAPVPVGAPV